jgi:hypothetical protein
MMYILRTIFERAVDTDSNLWTEGMLQMVCLPEILSMSDPRVLWESGKDPWLNFSQNHIWSTWHLEVIKVVYQISLVVHSHVVNITTVGKHLVKRLFIAGNKLACHNYITIEKFFYFTCFGMWQCNKDLKTNRSKLKSWLPSPVPISSSVMIFSLAK